MIKVPRAEVPVAEPVDRASLLYELGRFSAGSRR